MNQIKIGHREPIEVICKAEWVVDNTYYNDSINLMQLNGHMEYTELELLIRCGDCIYSELDKEDGLWCDKLKIEVDPRFYCAIGKEYDMG